MGMTNAEIKRIVRAIQALGARGAPFQFQAIRKKIGVEANESARSAYIHNFVKELLTKGVLESISPDRQRNRFYRVMSEWKLEASAQPTSPFFYNAQSKRRTPSTGATASRAKVRPAAAESSERESVNRIEDGIQEIFLRLENIEVVLAEIRALWK